MVLFDQHIHCLCSPDSRAPMRDMAEAARDHGMALVCFTDHVEMDDSRTGQPHPDWAVQWPKIRDAHAHFDPPAGIEVRMGVELAAPNHDPALAAEICQAAEWDFILGSLHNLRGAEDFYYMTYVSEAQCEELNRAYLAELLEIAGMDCFDVMAHVGYTTRYMSRAGFTEEIRPGKYREELTALFRALIHAGKGIEVNASGLRQMGSPYPNAEVLALYRELGGEIVSVGSDAHRPEDAGIGIREAMELLSALGFRYAAEYKKRKPVFIPLD